jgi:hypothetical protein
VRQGLRAALLQAQSTDVWTSLTAIHHSLLCTQLAVNFIEFIEALRYVATSLRVSLNEVLEKIVLINAPLPDS